MRKVNSAIEAAAQELANTGETARVTYVNTLTNILAADRIPSSIEFYCTPIIGKYSKEQQKKHGDGRHVDISLNYVLEVPSAHRRGTIGLTDVVEVFRIIKPTDQKRTDGDR